MNNVIKQSDRTLTVKADMFTNDKKDPFTMPIRDMDVSAALVRMWYDGLQQKDLTKNLDSIKK